MLEGVGVIGEIKPGDNGGNGTEPLPLILLLVLLSFETSNDCDVPFICGGSVVPFSDER